MELRTLKYFLTVAREENITHAADVLHITQPTLSRQMAALEEELGVTLFERGSHHITLTDSGMILRRRAQEIVELTCKTVEEMAHADMDVAGNISIGAGETANMEYLAQGIAAFQKRYPDVTFSVYTAIADDVKEKLEQGFLDFGLVADPVDISTYHFVQLPKRDGWCLFMRRDDPLAKLPCIHPKDLSGQDIIIPMRPSVRNDVENWLGPYAGTIRIRGHVNLSVHNMGYLVRAGVGKVLTFMLETVPDEFHLCPLEPDMKDSGFFVWRKNQFVAKPVHLFQDFFKDYIAGLSADTNGETEKKD